MIKNIAIGLLAMLFIMSWYDNNNNYDKVKELKSQIKVSKWQIKQLSNQNDILDYQVWEDSVKIAESDSIIRAYKNNLLKIKYDYEEKTNDYLNDSLNNRIRVFAKLATDR